MDEVRIYVEGGGDGSEGRARLRQGFKAFLKELDSMAETKGIHLRVIACGSRNSCFDDFTNAAKSHPTAFNILLVDSEAPVCSSPRAHLKARDNWTIKTTEENCHLMVQMMESWLVADVEALRRYYGQGFLESAITRNNNVEDVGKASIDSSLEHATKNTQKGKYQKIRHGSELLERIDPRIVRTRAPHCERLFQTISFLLGAA